MRHSVELRLPDWAVAAVRAQSAPLAGLEDRMRFAIELSRSNAAHGSGGPFGAAVFERASGALVAAGVNLVIPQRCSAAHAEIVALSLAQATLGSYTLAEDGRPAMQLVSSTEPCAMCLGALPWSGIAELVCGAEDRDAREAGFDEGAKPAGWADALEQRGIRVVPGVLRETAAEVLRDYVARGGPLYNARRSER